MVSFQSHSCWPGPDDDVKPWLHNSLLAADDAFRISRILSYRGPLARARQKVLRSLVESMDMARSSPAIRAKAVKAIGMVLDVDASLLQLQELHHGISHALQVQ